MLHVFISDVQGLGSSSVGGLELQQQRQRIQHLAKETNALLKKNVYNNYMQFIETAKEISCEWIIRVVSTTNHREIVWWDLVIV